MTRPDKDEAREECIHMEIIVDACGPGEQAGRDTTCFSLTFL